MIKILKKNRFNSQFWFYLIVISLFLSIASFELFTEGMFMDGLIYGTISKNMASGQGSFWTPHFSNTLFNEFYEHPPLALGMESVFFKIFGDGFITESLYSLFVFSLTGFVIVIIWREFTGRFDTGWLPLLLWISVQSVVWSVGNNMLENTMSLFVVLSFFFYLKSLKYHRYLFVLLAGITLSFGLFTKGFFCLYIWGSPFFIWWLKRENKFIDALVDTALLVLATVLPVVLLFFLSEGAANSMTTYFVKQVAGSIENAKTVDSRLAIIGFYLQEVIFPVLIFALIVIYSKIKKWDVRVMKKYYKTSIFLFLVSLSGVLPIMISLKQRNFYIVTVYPFVALALGLLLLPLIIIMIEKIKQSSMRLLWLKALSLVVLFASILLVIYNYGRIGRDKEIICDSKEIVKVVGNNTTIDISPGLYQYYNLLGYLSRNGSVSCDRDKSTFNNYYISLSTEGLPSEQEANYNIVNIETDVLVLYKRKS